MYRWASSPSPGILASADRPISGRLSLVRLAEDSRLVGHYRDDMRARLGPDRVDLLLAAALLFGVVLQAVIPPMTTSERLVTLVVGGLVTASVAVRRRFPAAVGIGVQALLVVTGLAVSLPAGPVTIALVLCAVRARGVDVCAVVRRRAWPSSWCRTWRPRW